MNQKLQALSKAGVSVWLDDLSRDRLTSGNLAGLIADYSVVGVTTNPTIFAAAVEDSADYADQLALLRGATVEEAMMQLTTEDVRDACELFDPIYRATKGVDGRVSIEVEPGLAYDAAATVAQAAELYERVGRENVLIKIPATREGLGAITDTIAAGISVNATLIFSVERYREVVDAYLTGLERAALAGRDLSRIHSVASFFVSRVDAEIDARLEKLGRSELAGRAGIANAAVAYAVAVEVFDQPRFQALAAKGANRQRPLWASTGTKNPAYSDTLYVSGLVAADVVNTMPEKTMMAFADHGGLDAALGADATAPAAVLAEIQAAGVDLADVFQTLEDEGVAKFVASWKELTRAVTRAQAAIG
ncbi:MAG: transaldolase [Actinobacteria bacterium HGW-Actinobacteria-2]|nr:MAG: transaldolase [Actinobacteria bacterium HGW-Actinobacteria-2]